MTDPVYIYRGHGRNAIYARPEGTDRKVSCLPGSRVHMSGAEIAAYDDQPLVSFDPIEPPKAAPVPIVEPERAPEPAPLDEAEPAPLDEAEPAPLAAPEPAELAEVPEPPADRFADMSRSDLWAAVKSRGLHEEFDLDYRSTDSDEMREILSAFPDERDGR